MLRSLPEINSDQEVKMHLDVKAFSLACGILWGSAVFFATLWLMAFGFEGYLISQLDHFYFGYSLSFLGAVIGGAWGFVDGAISGALLAWLYNRFAKVG
jgi:hypothetical protein